MDGTGERGSSRIGATPAPSTPPHRSSWTVLDSEERHAIATRPTGWCSTAHSWTNGDRSEMEEVKLLASLAALL
jgi:hypothetical protein